MWMCSRCQTINEDIRQICPKCGNRHAPATPEAAPKPPAVAAEAVKPKPPSAPSQPGTPGQPKFKHKDPLAAMQRMVARDVQRVAAEDEDGGDEHIDWSSAASVGGAVRKHEEKRRSARTASDAGSFGALPGAAVDDASATSSPVAAKTLVRTLSGVIAALVIVIGIMAVSYGRLADDATGQSAYDTAGPAALFSRSIDLTGLWLGTDNVTGNPIRYVFTPSGYFAVVGTDATNKPTAMGEGTYRISGKILTAQVVNQISAAAGGSAPIVAPSATINSSRDSLTLSGAGQVLSLHRPFAVLGSWVPLSAAEPAAARLYTFASGAQFSMVPIGQAKPVKGTYRLAGNTISATAGGTALQWSFTFNGSNLVLYPSGGGSPIHLKPQEQARRFGL